jgi:septum formation protein
MTRQLILASASPIRLQLLQNAGLQVTARPARVDEDSLRASLQADHASPRDIADALAEMKARKIAEKDPAALVLGCDQVLEFDGQLWTKPETLAEARQQLQTLRGKTHRLHSALVVYDAAQPVWRHIGTARLTMRENSDTYLDAYLSRHWPALAQSLGGYQIESEGVRLFSAIDGDLFTIQGLPLLPLLTWLGLRGFIAQ